MGCKRIHAIGYIRGILFVETEYVNLFKKYYELRHGEKAKAYLQQCLPKPLSQAVSAIPATILLLDRDEAREAVENLKKLARIIGAKVIVV